MLTIPKGWRLIETGGGGQALARDLDTALVGHAEWLITTRDEPSPPTSSDEPCVLTLWLMHDALLQWDCSCLAEAVQIAEGART